MALVQGKRVECDVGATPAPRRALKMDSSGDSDKDGQTFIIDGQQRLTTLTLLLIFRQHQLGDADQKGQIAELIFSQKYGTRSFHLDIPERTSCMEALYKGEESVDTNASESVTNILARYDWPARE